MITTTQWDIVRKARCDDPQVETSNRLSGFLKYCCFWRWRDCQRICNTPALYYNDAVVRRGDPPFSFNNKSWSHTFQSLCHKDCPCAKWSDWLASESNRAASVPIPNRRFPTSFNQNMFPTGACHANGCIQSVMFHVISPFSTFGM